MPLIYAKPLDWETIKPAEALALVDTFADHPEFLTYPMHREAARALGAELLTNPGHLVYLTYNDRTLTGCVILTRIIPRVDALVHFLFLDKELANKRRLLRNLIGFFFTDLGFNRLSMEVPEGVRLERFARKVLDFRLEGELRPRNPELPKALSDNWVARQGSRRESSYFDGTAWRDIVLLRLLASEWVGEQEVECRSEPSQEPQPPSLEAPSEAPSEAEDQKTPSPPSLETSSPSDSKT